MAKIWKDHNGNTIPAKYIPAIDKKREAVALTVYKKGLAAQERLRKLKEEAFLLTDDIWDRMLEEAKVKKLTKGNYSITTFDKEIKIEVNVQEIIDFDDNIQLAHEKIKEYLALKTNGTDAEIHELINHAFSTSKGKMDVKRILGLFKLKITNRIWLEAMGLIKKSISRNHSKRYMRIWKKNEEGQYIALDLNFSSL